MERRDSAPVMLGEGWRSGYSAPVMLGEGWRGDIVPQ